MIFSRRCLVAIFAYFGASLFTTYGPRLRPWERDFGSRAPTQDLRAAQWQEQAVSYSHGKIIGEVTPPESGNLAFYGELDYEIEGIRYHLSTQMRMAGCTAESGHACRTREP